MLPRALADKCRASPTSSCGARFPSVFWPAVFKGLGFRVQVSRCALIGGVYGARLSLSLYFSILAVLSPSLPQNESTPPKPKSESTLPKSNPPSRTKWFISNHDLLASRKDPNAFPGLLSLSIDLSSPSRHALAHVTHSSPLPKF